MSDAFPVRQRLRSETAGWHDRVDAVFTRFDLSDAVSYGRFLTAQAMAHLAVEAALDAAGVAAVLPDWPDRQRAPLLRSDLAALGLATPPLRPFSVLDGAAALLGAAYVLEGSRLGGALLRRSVPAALPTQFLGASDSAAWRRLLDALDRHVTTAEDVAAATISARQVFSLFEESGTTILKAA